MALLKLSERDERVIMAYELDDFNLAEGEKKVITVDDEFAIAKDDSETASLALKRAHGDTFRAGTVVASGLSASPTKRRKKDAVVGEEEVVQEFVTQCSRFIADEFNAHGEVFAEAEKADEDEAEADGSSDFVTQCSRFIADEFNGFNANGEVFAEAEKADGDEAEADGSSAHGKIFSKADEADGDEVEADGCNSQGKIFPKADEADRDETEADGFNAYGKVFAKADEVDGDVVGIGDGIESTESGSKEESLTGRGGRGNADDRTGSPNPGQGNIFQTGSQIAERGCDESRRKRAFDIRLEQSGSDAAASSERADEDSGASSSATSNDTGDFSVEASVNRRQRNDPEFREKVHKVETDFWAERISRAVYNEERFKLYSKEEVEEACIMWPPRDLCSPASFREGQLESWGTCEGPLWDDLLFQFGCPFDEETDKAGAEEAAKKRLMGEIERKFKDPDGKMAEYKRWERIREVETEFNDNRISEDEYSERRFALYTEEEREENGIVWPDEERCSPAAYRDDVLYQFEGDDPDLQTCMEFHLPLGFRHADKADEENVCELCIPLIKEHEDMLERKKKEQREAQQRAEERRRLEAALAAQRAEKMRQEAEEKRRKKKAQVKPHLCAECNRKFATESARSQHTDAKHKK